MPAEFSEKVVEPVGSTDFDTSAKGKEAQRHATDALLRLHGFTIAARPPKGPPVWQRKGQLYAQDLAERIAHDEQQRRQQALQHLEKSGSGPPPLPGTLPQEKKRKRGGLGM
jgi:hypothetical protein